MLFRSRDEGRWNRDRRGGFTSGTGDDVPPVCAVCLGRQPGHNMRKCQETRLWNGATDAFAKRTAKGYLVARDGNVPLCLDWQRPGQCPDTEHGMRCHTMKWFHARTWRKALDSTTQSSSLFTGQIALLISINKVYLLQNARIHSISDSEKCHTWL